MNENLEIKQRTEERILNRIEAEKAFKSVFEKIANSSTGMSELTVKLAALDIQIKDETGKWRKMSDVLDELSKKFKNIK